MPDVALRGQAPVRRAGPEEHDRAAEVLAAAFADDPCWSWLLPFDDRERRERAFFESELSHLVPDRRQVWVSEDGGATAVWAPPGRWVAPVPTVIRQSPAMLRVFGRRLGLAMRYLVRVERLHPRRPKHWYLHYLGAEPASQGRGLGSALLRPILALCDRDGIGAYLEASSERNCRLYERHGFRVVEAFTMPGGGPKVRRMWRQPQR